jgi:pyruvate,water dikinase
MGPDALCLDDPVSVRRAEPLALVAWLQDLDREAVARSGGKAAHLGELVRAGLPVPPGFVVTTAAYQHFVEANALQPEIERLAQAAPPEDATALETAAQAIAALFSAGAMPEAVTAAIREAYRQLGRPPVAVRSSATVEDLPTASFAGQLESYLNVHGDEAVLAAVRRCWAALWTPRALSYRARLGLPPAAVRLAVVVQELIAAAAAGVLFTANPVTGHRGQMVLDAVWGMGEALVSGRANPDRWVIEARTGKVVEAHLARKEHMTACKDAGTALVPVPAPLQQQSVLNESQVADLLALGRRVADLFGSPQDIEWALAQDRLYLVQSRPITALFPLPQPEPPPEAGLRVYFCGNVMQGVVEPLTPMGLALLRNLINAMAAFKYGLKVPPGEAAPAFKVAAGRLFLDITVPLRHPQARQDFPWLVSLMDPHVAAILQALLEREPRLQPVRRRLPVKLPLGFALGLVGRLLHAVRSPEATRRRLVAAADRLVRQIEQRAEAVRGPAACRRFVEAELPRRWPQLVYHALPLVAPGMAARFLSETLLRRWLNDPAALQPVLRSLPHNPTMEMDLALWRLSRLLKAEGAVPAADHPAVREFLARYGHRGVREIDVGMPRWREDPGQLLSVLDTYLRHDPEADPERQFHTGARAAEAAVDALVDRVRQSKGGLRARLLAFLLHRLRALGGLREYPKFLLVRVLAAVRQALARAGAELVAAGRLDRAADVFFLDLTDLESPADLRALAAKHRADYGSELHRKVIPRVMTSEGETFYTAPFDCGLRIADCGFNTIRNPQSPIRNHVVPGALAGTAATPGIYEGKARVILDPKGAKLEPGEVLVAPSTDPAWTPLFLSAGALVMELGGLMSHGSVVAREYGIPAVVGVPDATRRLHTGQRVRVDGERGQVLPL